MSVLSCPICKEKLNIVGNTYVCKGGHSFDTAKEGYVHLLLPNKMNSKLPGDSKEMINDRHTFLERGYYEPLCKELCNIVSSLDFSSDEINLIDFGCGEGYYTERIISSLKTRVKCLNSLGIDISKAAVRLASKRHCGAEFAVASVYDIPCIDNMFHIALNVFSPLAIDELRRVLKSNGYFIYVVPAAKHLWEMKSVLYSRPYENTVESTVYSEFEHIKTVPVRYRINLNNREDIKALFGMTPYYWRSPKKGSEKLLSLNELECTVEFDILVFIKQ